MTDKILQTKLNVHGYTNVILPGAKSSARRDSFITSKINEQFEDDAHINASTNHRAFDRDAQGNRVVADFNNEAPTIRVALFNSMSNRGGSDLMFTRRICEAVQWGREQGLVDNDVNVEIIPVSSDQLDHRLEGESKKRDLAYVDDYHYTFSEITPKQIDADAWIVTGGVPREDHIEKEAFWHGVKKVIHHVRESGSPALFSCLASQAYLYEVYGVERYKRQKTDGKPDPLYGHYKQTLNQPKHPIFEGVVQKDKDVIFPVSRGWQTNEDQIAKIEETHKRFNSLASFPEGGASIILDRTKGSSLLLTSHPEYDVSTLHGEYVRNVGLDPDAAKPLDYDVENIDNNADVYADQPRLIFNAIAPLLKRAQLRYDESKITNEPANNVDYKPAYAAPENSAFAG